MGEEGEMRSCRNEHSRAPVCRRPIPRNNSDKSSSRGQRAGASPQSQILIQTSTQSSLSILQRKTLRWTISTLFFILLCAHPQIVSAQSSDPHEAQPERPTVATHAGTVAPGWIEIESGGELDSYSDHSHGSGFPFTLKLGLGSNVQFSVFAGAVLPPTSSTMHLGDLSFGVKWRISDNLPVIGKFALLPSIRLPTGSTASSAGTGTVDGNVLLISDHDIGPVALDINFGYTRRCGNGTATPRNATLWTVSFGGPAVGVLGWVAELYGLPGTFGPAGQAPTTATLFGPTFTLDPWLVLDTGVIVPLAGPQPRAFYFGGVWNINRVW